MPGPLPNTKYTVANGIYIPEFYADFKVITSGPYDVLQTDYILLVDTSGGSIDINLQTNDPFIPGKILYIKDNGGVSSANPINIINVTIDNGNPTVINDNYKGIQIIYYDTDTWYKLSDITK
jgi:hypothetical protein